MTRYDYSDIQDFNDLYDYELVFIALHGFEGENGELQARLDKMNIILKDARIVCIRTVDMYMEVTFKFKNRNSRRGHRKN